MCLPSQELLSPIRFLAQNEVSFASLSLYTRVANFNLTMVSFYNKSEDCKEEKGERGHTDEGEAPELSPCPRCR